MIHWWSPPGTLSFIYSSQNHSPSFSPHINILSVAHFYTDGTLPQSTLFLYSKQYKRKSHVKLTFKPFCQFSGKDNDSQIALSVCHPLIILFGAVEVGKVNLAVLVCNACQVDNTTRC